MFFNVRSMTNVAAVAAAAGLLATPVVAQPALLDDAHVDIGVAYEDGEWDLHIHQETPIDVEFEPDEAILVVDSTLATTQPTNPAFDFIGAADDATIWIATQSDPPGDIFLGVAGEETAPGIFVGDVMDLTLKAFSGPGEFSVYQVGGTAVPDIMFDTFDGIGADDVMEVSAGTHDHFNWAFTSAGFYSVTFEASGILNDGNSTFTSSGDVVYTFQVIPEPTSAALLAGLGGLALVRRRKAS
ncbi:MAG: choice-of-anchor M domain-containing protein [Planctomycetota bacterium]